MSRIALRLLLAALLVGTVVVHWQRDRGVRPAAIDPYRKADAILAARGFTRDASAPSWGLATDVVSYSSDACPQGVTLAALTYDQLRIVLDRTPAASATSYLVVGPSWESSSLGRFGLFFAALACKASASIGAADADCERYLYVADARGCLHRDDWRDFWRAR